MSTLKSAPSRRVAREVAFQFIYSRHHDNAATRDEFDGFCKSFELAAEQDEFAWSLVQGTLDSVKSLDEELNRVSKNWRVERMPKVDLAILRLAAYEILNSGDVPKNVSINEAIELGKKYGTEGTPAFVNGILDKVTKSETSSGV